ncbi:glycoside hydrolase domain-containing protein [Paenibacillus mucilaginosus]|uniref:Rv2525c-like glycoside hydrolase-like domain-containing protein n=1 Tax=Paenibacillus mucilaginosus (strain KNP414) TaxID=1036673 RepID=F8FR82_PAEMK|nr:glycoside hydrolase domain-containing protein [Paenibacillus mucilaginosus]AEI39332.1 hypothetical protein KNP414_00742 [Paenibacillus mucilaginosus KNP414]MCG7216963.1 DUF1906 domain-containing protein [Paenibacillus mucilaginosus]WDM28326.1 DUF1906 domain-containing protein [Paenibacillus mucilaginosus]
MATYVWGVDSASPVDEKLLSCVTEQFGKPRFWGRYLTTIQGVASGLSKGEISLLHRQGIRILPIYNEFRAATGYENGKKTAQEAAQQARRLGIPRGTFLFSNVERFFAVDTLWILGWVNTIRTTGYKSGIYHDPVQGGFSAAFCEAVRRDYRVTSETALWSAEPQRPASGPDAPPIYAPKKPHCSANVWAWQYSRDVQGCPVDTNLMDTRLFGQLF